MLVIYLLINLKKKIFLNYNRRTYVCDITILLWSSYPPYYHLDYFDGPVIPRFQDILSHSAVKTFKSSFLYKPYDRVGLMLGYNQKKLKVS